MLYFPPAVIGDGVDEMCRILLAEDIECFFKSILLNQAMSGKVATRRISCNQVLFREEALGSSVVASREMYLRKPESIFVIFCETSGCASLDEIEEAYGSMPAACHL